MLKPSPLSSKAGTLVASTTEVEANPVRATLQRKPPRVVTISGREVAVQIPNHAIPELHDSLQNRFNESSDPQEVTDAQPDEVAIREELTRILGSKTFSRAVQLSYLLEWIVSRWLRGETELLDSYHVMMAVFHRTEILQSSFDATGRVYVGRLRAQLDRYYAGEGASNEVRVAIPVGKYVPVAYRQSPSHAAEPRTGCCERRHVMVLPFRLASSASTSAGLNPLSITDHLISRLTRTRNLRVASRVSASTSDSGMDARLLGQHFGVQFIVEGTVSHTLESCDLTVHLSETADGYNIWTGHYRTERISLTDLAGQIVRDLLRRIKLAPKGTR